MASTNKLICTCLVIKLYSLYKVHTGVLFKEQEILKFSDIYLYQIGKFMYLFKRSLLPNYFRDMFTLASQIHSIYLVVELIFENSQFGFNVLRLNSTR